MMMFLLLIILFTSVHAFMSNIYFTFFKPFKEETGSSKDQVVEEKPNDLVVEKTVVKDEATTAPKEEVVVGQAGL